MKPSVYLLITLVGWAACLQGNQLHTLTSADGSKTMQASIEGVQPANNTATINVKGRRMTVPISAFKAEDKTKFDKWLEASEVGRKLQVDFDDTAEVTNEKKTKTAKITESKSGYKLEVRNNAQMELSDVTLQYQIFYSVDDGDRESKMHEGELQLKAIAPRETVSLSTETVALTRQRPDTWAKAAGGWKPPPRASSRTDKVEGIVVRLVKDGQVVRTINYPSSLRKSWQEG